MPPPNPPPRPPPVPPPPPPSAPPSSPPSCASAASASPSPPKPSDRSSTRAFLLRSLSLCSLLSCFLFHVLSGLLRATRFRACATVSSRSSPACLSSPPNWSLSLVIS